MVLIENSSINTIFLKMKGYLSNSVDKKVYIIAERIKKIFEN